jgi:heme A synthase
MKNVYRVLAYLVAAAVAFQAAAIAYAVFALGSWVQKGGTLDKSVMENGGAGGEGGFMAHGTGAIVVAVLALALLVVSFFAKRVVAGAVKFAAITFGLVVLQWVLGIASFSLPGLGILHAVNALAIFGVATMAAMRASRGVPQAATAESVAAPVR